MLYLAELGVYEDDEVISGALYGGICMLMRACFGISEI